MSLLFYYLGKGPGIMGKTIRFDSKYSNESLKHANEECSKIKRKHKQSGKLSSLSKKSKRCLKDKFLQRFWPLGSEKKKGHKV